MTGLAMAKHFPLCQCIQTSFKVYLFSLQHEDNFSSLSKNAWCCTSALCVFIVQYNFILREVTVFGIILQESSSGPRTART